MVELPFAIQRGLSQPDDDFNCSMVDLTHEGNLVVFFPYAFFVTFCLIDRACIDPEKCLTRVFLLVIQKIPKILSDPEDLPM